MTGDKIVIDTNVWLAALKSNRGASYELLNSIDSGLFKLAISVPLILEYEEVALNHLNELRLSEIEVGDLLDYICQKSHHQPVFYKWRPFLRDPDDDMILELAVAAGCKFIVTGDRDFSGVNKFGLEAVRPGEVLLRLGLWS